LLSTAVEQRAALYSPHNGVHGIFASKIEKLARMEIIAKERELWRFKSATSFNDIMSLKVVEEFIKRDLQSQFGASNENQDENFKMFYKFFIGTRMYRNYKGTHLRSLFSEEVFFSMPLLTLTF
jgi:hypothetical protein